MGAPGVFEFGLLIALAFYGFIIWLAWTLVTSVKGIREEMTLVREELRKLSDRDH
jgi:hypothetical protein